jgi:catechol 2,3-dioxygenase-like lactoylglutathione lyase family enzyme
MTGETTDSGQNLKISLDHVSIMVPVLDDSLDWYQEKLGARLLDRWDDPEKGMEWAKLAVGDFVLELVKMPGFDARPPRTYGHHHFSITVDDCSAFTQRLADLGAEIFREPTDFERHQFRWSFVKDNLGNVIEVISPFPKKADA